MALDTFFFEVGSSESVMAARDFYRIHFGMRLLSAEDADDYVFLTDGDMKLGFLYGDAPNRPELMNLGITVDDLEGEVARLAAAGVVFTVPTEPFSWGRAAGFADPAGLGVWLIQRGSMEGTLPGR